MEPALDNDLYYLLGPREVLRKELVVAFLLPCVHGQSEASPDSPAANPGSEELVKRFSLD